MLTAQKTEGDVDGSLALNLLTDIRSVWPYGRRTLLTAELLPSLRTIEESPWCEAVELSPTRLAKILRPFGVKPKQVRSGELTRKGYHLDDLETAFGRYLTPVKETCETDPILTG